MSRSRSWFITINNYSAEEYLQLKAHCKEIRYGIVSKEVGTKEHTPHLHALLCYSDAKSFDTIKKRFPRANIEPQKGTFKQAVCYIKKDGRWKEYGEPLSQGKRSDCDNVYQCIKEGKTLPQIIEDCPTAMRMLNAIEQVKSLNFQERKTELLVWPYPSIEIPEYVIDNYESYLIVHDIEEAVLYDDQQVLVIISPSFPQIYLRNWSLGVPVNLKFGYTYKKILPRRVIFTYHKEFVEDYGIQEIRKPTSI